VNTKSSVHPSVFKSFCDLLPTPKQKPMGRPRCSKEALVEGILLVLRQGIAWNNISVEGASGTSCFRYFRELQRRGAFHLAFRRLSQSVVHTSECSVDTTSISSFRFKGKTGWDGKHKKVATKVSLFSNKEGLPLSVVCHKGSVHDLHFVPKHLKDMYGRGVKLLHADKGYTSINLRRSLRRKGIRVNMEIRKGDYVRKRGPKFGFDGEKYVNRLKLERTFAWLKSFRGLRLRRSYLFSSFMGMVYVGLIVILIRNLDF